MHSAVSFAPSERLSGYYNVSESLRSDHPGMGFGASATMPENSVFSDNFYANEMHHAGIQSSWTPNRFRGSFGASVPPDVYGSERTHHMSHAGDATDQSSFEPSLYRPERKFGAYEPLGLENPASRPSASSFLQPNVYFSSNLFDRTPNDGTGSITAPTSANVTPRSSTTPWEAAETKPHHDFAREHYSRDQVNREYTFRDHSPLSGRYPRTSFSHDQVGPKLDLHRLSQSMHSLQLGESRFLETFAPSEPLATSSSRSSIWSTGKPNSSISLDRNSCGFLDFATNPSAVSLGANTANSLNLAQSQASVPRLSQQRYSNSLIAPDFARSESLFARDVVPQRVPEIAVSPAKSQADTGLFAFELTARPASRKLSDGSAKGDPKRRKPMVSSKVAIDFGSTAKEPIAALSQAKVGRNSTPGPFAKNYSNYMLQSCPLKEHREDFCSTFYKRNTHGYMFIRESSNSLKVNTSGSKSWVTIKIKLGEAEQRKINVDSKRLPVWKPINLNQPHTSRKSTRKRRPFKKSSNRRR